MAEYRTGRRNRHTIYFQPGSEPSDGDPFIGSCVDPGQAACLVEWANIGQASRATPLGSPVSEIEPIRAQDPPKTPEGKLVDLMGALERSVNEAKASRKRKRAELKAAYDGLCVAEGCTTPHLTAWDDGEGPLLLCERHGDELAVGFPLKPGAREVSA